MEQQTPSERRGYHRIVVAAILVLLALGLFPATAAVLDESHGSLIIPVFALVMAVSGVLLWTLTPQMAAAGVPVGRRVVTGAVMGLVAAAVAGAVFFLLVNGFSGA